MELNRREFLKTSGVALGATVLGEGFSTSLARKGSIAEAAGPIPVYEIYAAKYAGPFTRKLAYGIWTRGWEENIQIPYCLWVIKGPEGFILVDTGCGISWAREKKLQGFVNPVEILTRIGVNGTNVSKVIITHMHFDHLGGMEMFPAAFPKATFYVQKTEYDFWTKSPYSNRAPFSKDKLAIKATADLEGTDRLVFTCGDQKILPGIEVMLCPGHTPGLQTIAVNTAKGTAVVASDLVYLHKGFMMDLPSAVMVDMISWLKGYDTIRAKATSTELVFGGHDMVQVTDYPRVAEDITRLV